jgi:hypothetical protein
MLKLLFWGLLLANGVLFAFHQRYLDSWLPEAREPTRMAKQLNADKIKLISASAALAAPVPAPESAAASAVVKEEVLACTEIGNFNEVEAKRFETRLSNLSLSDKPTRRNIQDVSRHIVYIPPQGGKEGADKKVAELRNLGIKDFFVIQDSSALRWGISLGIFKTEEAARAQLAAVSKKGVRSARLGVQNAASNKVVFQLRQLDAGTKRNLDNIKADFPNQEIRDCVTERQ